jgi:CRP/FNR family transcriptional regulator, cyclic AMP receptor protein
MTTPIAQLVATHPLLAGLPGDAVGEVAGCARNVAYAPGDLLLAEGDVADTLFLVRRGRIAIEIHAPDRGPIVVETVGPGATVGWSWLFPPHRWQFDARAVDAVGVIAVDGKCLRAKADADDAFGHQLVTRMASVLLERLQATRIRLLDLYGTSGGH